MLVLMLLGCVVLCSVVIMYACDSFEDASEFLGRNMPPGVRGATINAVGSSLPELMTTMFFLFVQTGPDGNALFSAGVATCAGSAVFNAVIIPALCIVVVLFFGVTKGGVTTRVSSIEVSRSTVIRDGAFFIAAEIALVYFLSGTKLVWWMGGALMLIYLAYFSFLMFQIKRSGGGNGGDEDEDGDGDEDGDEPPGKLKALITFDFNHLLFGGRDLTTGRAWVVLTCSVVVIGLACYGLTEAVIHIAHALDVKPYFTAVILAAAATSVPDTVLSLKDARKGDYEDAIANAVGSNIFDICVALGFPLLLYGLIYGQEVSLDSSLLQGASDVQELRIILIVATGIVLALFLIGRKLGKLKALLLLSLYLTWLSYVILRGMGHLEDVGRIVASGFGLLGG